MTHQTFETERLLLQPTLEQDADLILELMNTPKWIQYIGDRKLSSIEKAQQYIREKMMPQLERLGYSNYTIIRKSDKVKLGTAGLYDREGLDGIDIGFALLPAYERQGYAYEASNRIKQAAFEEFGITELCAITTPDNKSSQKLLEKLGLISQGIITLSNDDEELLFYTLKK